MTEYVAGFMLNLDKSKVALIRKTKPAWQKGYLNGIGGKIEPNESSIAAMCREFEEETSVTTSEEDWVLFSTAVNVDKTWRVDFYYCVTSDEDFQKLKSTTEEEIIVVNVADLEALQVIPNLRWLIRMCLDREFNFGQITVA